MPGNVLSELNRDNIGDTILIFGIGTAVIGIPFGLLTHYAFINNRLFPSYLPLLISLAIALPAIAFGLERLRRRIKRANARWIIKNELGSKDVEGLWQVASRLKSRKIIASIASHGDLTCGEYWGRVEISGTCNAVECDFTLNTERYRGTPTFDQTEFELSGLCRAILTHIPDAKIDCEVWHYDPRPVWIPDRQKPKLCMVDSSKVINRTKASREFSRLTPYWVNLY